MIEPDYCFIITIITLDPKRIAQFREHGYLFLRPLFAPEELTEVTGYILEHFLRNQDIPEVQPHKTDKYLRDFCLQDRFADVMEALLGPDIALWTVHLFYKPPLTGKRTPWHQDAKYWAMKPVVTASIWLALEPVDRENGCMEFVPGTHRGPLLEHHELDLETDRAALGLEIDREVDPDSVIPVELDTGEATVHHSHLLHGAAPNTSGRSRNALVVRYMPTSSIRTSGDMVLARGRDLSNGRNVYVDCSPAGG